MTADDAIRYLKGVGEKKAGQYARGGIRTIRDLLYWFPRDYEDWSRTVFLSQALPDTPCCIRGRVLCDVQEYQPRRGMTLYRFRVTDGWDTAQVTLFNNPYAAKAVHYNQEILLYGIVKGEDRRFELSAPKIAGADDGSRIRPIYRRIGNLTTYMIERDVRRALESVSLSDELPADIRERLGLAGLETALRSIHFPSAEEDIAKARERLIFEELFVLQMGLLRMKHRSRHATGVMLKQDHTAEYTAGLPFSLTGAQRRAIRDCVADLQKATPMARLVQGDVGSGKTAVAAGAAYSLIREGWQVAMMAPTEILAQQHAASLQALLGDKVRVGLLTGSVTAARRRPLLDKLKSGEIDLLVGTHALLTDKVQFARLGLVITDEQHRFGVQQRAKLTDKGADPHMLVMSATPIPRTLALIIYGDLDLSVLDELPPGRQLVATYAVGSDKRDRAYGYVRRFLDEGRQGFIVCPLVEENDDSPASLHSAKEVFDILSGGPFAGYRVGLLHGRMKPAQKEATMTAFAAGEIQLLICTTVIEVGVDVPNAVIMVVENADRFGLAQLHQLRGRVGRGRYPAACVLLSDSTGEDTRRRLKVMCATNDGFRIADEDMRLRGPGDFFGNRQSGLPQMRIADLMVDSRLLHLAQTYAANRLSADPTLSLPENIPLREAVERLFEQVGESGLQ